MFTISFHAWRPGWIASQLSFVYHLRRSSESLFLMAQNLISITMFLGIDWTETSWRCSFFLITRSDIQSRLHFCFVCRYCADTLPWARGRPRPLDVFFFFASSSSSLQITIFYICPKQAFFFNFFSSLLFASPLFSSTTTASIGRSSVTVSYVSKQFLVSLYVSTHFKITFQA
jgi:hypothetical protein